MLLCAPFRHSVHNRWASWLSQSSFSVVTSERMLLCNTTDKGTDTTGEEGIDDADACQARPLNLPAKKVCRMDSWLFDLDMALNQDSKLVITASS